MTAMQPQPIALKSTGLVTSVGLSAQASCAAIRAKISNPSETRFIDSYGEWIMVHQVPLAKPWRGRTKLVKMATMAIAECLEGVPRETWGTMPLLLCVAERERPGRLEGLDDQLLLEIQQEVGVRFAPDSAVVAHGRVGLAIALAQARKLIHGGRAESVLIATADSFLDWATLEAYERDERLLTAQNSNGFMPGEAGGALLVGRPGGRGELLCSGIGFGMEKASIESGEPLRAEALSAAIREALRDAGCRLHDLDYRIGDLSGEQYYFKEAALALSRLLRQRKEEFDLWHPAESIGESGAAAGMAVLAVAWAAGQKGYAPGSNVLAHMANDAGQRAAMVLQFVGA